MARRQQQSINSSSSSFKTLLNQFESNPLDKLNQPPVESRVVYPLCHRRATREWISWRIVQRSFVPGQLPGPVPRVWNPLWRKRVNFSRACLELIYPRKRRQHHHETPSIICSESCFCQPGMQQTYVRHCFMSDNNHQLHTTTKAILTTQTSSFRGYRTWSPCRRVRTNTPVPWNPKEGRFAAIIVWCMSLM